MRRWKNSAAGTVDDDGSIHCLGNGELCAYEQGPNLIQLFGPPYSSPSFLQVALDMDVPVAVESEREPGAAIWSHRVTVEGRTAGQMTDFVDAELPCFVRQVRATEPLRFRLALEQPARAVDNGTRLAGAGGGLLLQVPAGRYLYHTYPFPAPIYLQLAWCGPTRAVVETGELVCEPGESWLFFAGGPDYPHAVQNAEAALSVPPEQLLERTRDRWQAFTDSRSDLGDELPAGLPLYAELSSAADDVAVLIRTQQSAEGAVLAGHNYHMGYVRDQYGVSRGLLALGHVEQAREILEYYWRVFQRHGRIHNAQAAGVNGVFHVHENDEVEITGYLIRQAFDLAQAFSGASAGMGDAYLDMIFPMLTWAWEAQKKHLVAGMLPFNGDETYVAGGILPRHTLNDGSAEATLLFIDGGERLLNWVERRGRWSSSVIADNRFLHWSVKSRYRENFFVNGQLVTNNPARAAQATLPRFRHGVCERCQAEGHPRGIVWTERNASGRYLCPECLSGEPFAGAPADRYALQSVSLTPFYLHSNLLKREDLEPLVGAIARRYLETGRLPSRPEDTGGISVGYDYGMLLYALTALRSPLAERLYRQTLALVDAAGAWVEYYDDHRPMGTRCRPWESAINLEAALYWAREAAWGRLFH